MADGPDLSWGDEEADDLEQYGPPSPRGRVDALMANTPTAADALLALQRLAVNTTEGILVTAYLNGNAPAPRATSGANELAAHRPTRYAEIMRRQAANRSRKARGLQQLPAVLPGGCVTCRGLGVVNGNRVRCPICKGSGER